jgi:hypothetical protein
MGATVAVRPALALVGSYELLMMVIRGSQAPVEDTSATGRDADPHRNGRLGTLSDNSWLRQLQYRA